MYCGKYVKIEENEEPFLYLAFNMHWIDHTFDLPTLPREQKWYLALDTSISKEDGIFASGEELLLQEQRSVCVAARSIQVLVGKS